MRYAVIADVHANLDAFSAVMDDIKVRGGVGNIWCLGDIVGYGPDPHQCIELLRQHSHICVAGNHDLAAIGKIDAAYFNPDATVACQWTTQQLSPEDIDYLSSLPLVSEKNDFTIVHGSPREPVWEYLISVSIAKQNFDCFKSRFCLVGHSHTPLVFKLGEDGTYYSSQFSPEVGLVLGRGRFIINPGGVGQPRDGDPRASYAIYDDETNVARLYRVPYDIKATQAKMLKQGLPVRLANRLSYGL